MGDYHQICEDCFYQYRAKDLACFQCHHHQPKIEVVWNDEKNRLETTARSIRPLPEDLLTALGTGGYVGMCDPRRGYCKKYYCTFAHGREEQRQWNRILRSRREESEGTVLFLSSS